MSDIRYYAGVGSRETPEEVCQKMTGLAEMLYGAGFYLRSGHADAADKAFEAGAKEKAEIWVPWMGFNNAPNTAPYRIALGHPNEKNFATVAERHHGNWGVCNPAAKKLLTRNVPIIMGEDLATPVEFVICWSTGPGGTAHALAIANRYQIPVFNLHDHNGMDQLVEFGKTL